MLHPRDIYFPKNKNNRIGLKNNQRYIDKDLNRVWLIENLSQLENKKTLNNEEAEQQELYKILKQIIKENSGPLYFIDLHTTSSKTRIIER